MKHYAKSLSDVVARLRESTPDTPVHAHTRAITNRLGQLADAVGMLEKVAKARDPVETEARHAQRVADYAKRLEIKANEFNEMISNSARAGTAELDEAINRRANLVENQYAQEIRSAARSMPRKERDQALRDAVSRGDAGVVAALTSAPALVAGYDPDLQSRMREAYREKHAGQEYQAMNHLHDVFSTASVVIGTAKRAAAEAADPRFISEIQAAQKAAREAGEAFSDALSD